MKFSLRWIVLFILTLFALSACGPSAADQERAAAAKERGKLEQERREVNEERRDMREEQVHKAKVENECTTAYNTCIARCDALLYSSSRAACVTDCANVRSHCLETK